MSVYFKNNVGSQPCTATKSVEDFMLAATTDKKSQMKYDTSPAPRLSVTQSSKASLMQKVNSIKKTINRGSC